jgi:DNA-binding transcriptional regulator YhcF (GntR family)
MGKLDLHLDRRVPASLTEQIKGQITYAISYGILGRGDPLPSVRELATRLKVAPMTVTHVYQDLAHQGLIVTKSGVGTFVADMARLQESERFQVSQDNLYHIMENCLRQATLLGHTVDEVQSVFLTVVGEYRAVNSTRHVLMVGNFSPATEDYAQQVESILRDLNVRVHSVLLSDLQADLDNALVNFRAARLAITVPTRLQEVRALLEPRRYHVAAIAFRMNAETRRKLGLISRTQRIGIVATYPEFLQTLADEVASYVLLKTPLQCAHLQQTKRIREMLKQIDVLVYASGSEKVLDWLPEHVEAIEFRHAPEVDSVNRLRPLMA